MSSYDFTAGENLTRVKGGKKEVNWGDLCVLPLIPFFSPLLCPSFLSSFIFFLPFWFSILHLPQLQPYFLSIMFSSFPFLTASSASSWCSVFVFVVEKKKWSTNILCRSLRLFWRLFSQQNKTKLNSSFWEQELWWKCHIYLEWYFLICCPSLPKISLLQKFI